MDQDGQRGRGGSALGVVVFVGFLVVFLSLLVVGGIAWANDNPWPAVAWVSILWVAMALGPALSRRERPAARWGGALAGCAWLVLLAVSIILRDGWLFHAISLVIIIAGFVFGVLYSLFDAFRASDPPSEPSPPPDAQD
jgi:cobalamin synthase